MYFTQQIEVVQKRANVVISLGLVHEAHFILDLTTFAVLKHRFGEAADLTPEWAYRWLCTYLEIPSAKILLLTD